MLSLGHLTIPATHRREGKSTVVFYEITFAYEAEEQRYADVVFRRYSEFHALHAKLSKSFPDVKLPKLPGKRLFGSLRDDFVEERRERLEEYLLLLQQHSDARVVQSEDVLSFMPDAYAQFVRKRAGVTQFGALEVAASAFGSRREVQLHVSHELGTLRVVHFDSSAMASVEDHPLSGDGVVVQVRRQGSHAVELSITPEAEQHDAQSAPDVNAGEDAVPDAGRLRKLMQKKNQKRWQARAKSTFVSHGTATSLLDPAHPATRAATSSVPTEEMSAAGPATSAAVYDVVLEFPSFQDREHFVIVLEACVAGESRAKLLKRLHPNDALLTSDNPTLEEVDEFMEYSVFTSTWNMAKLPPPEDIHEWVPHQGGGNDMLVIGLQECTQTQGSMIKKLRSQLGSKYYLVADKAMWEIRLFVFALRDKLMIGEQIHDIEKTSVATGIMGIMGNKGAVAISLTLNAQRLCFVSSHLAPHFHRYDDRNRMFREIVQAAGTAIGDRTVDLTLQFDLLVWLGDLNYRIDMPHEKVVELVQQCKWKELRAKDQLTYARRDHEAFNGFDEGEVAFAPTYKFLLPKKLLKQRKKARKLKKQQEQAAAAAAASSTTEEETGLGGEPEVGVLDLDELEEMTRTRGEAIVEEEPEDALESDVDEDDNIPDVLVTTNQNDDQELGSRTSSVISTTSAPRGSSFFKVTAGALQDAKLRIMGKGTSLAVVDESAGGDDGNAVETLVVQIDSDDSDDGDDEEYLDDGWFDANLEEVIDGVLLESSVGATPLAASYLSNESAGSLSPGDASWTDGTVSSGLFSVEAAASAPSKSRRKRGGRRPWLDLLSHKDEAPECDWAPLSPQTHLMSHIHNTNKHREFPFHASRDAPVRASPVLAVKRLEHRRRHSASILHEKDQLQSYLATKDALREPMPPFMNPRKPKPGDSDDVRPRPGVTFNLARPGRSRSGASFDGSTSESEVRRGKIGRKSRTRQSTVLRQQRPYNSKRIPSWTDRIMYKTIDRSTFVLHDYHVARNVLSSDHLPVIGNFTLRSPAFPPAHVLVKRARVTFEELALEFTDPRFTGERRRDLYLAFHGPMLAASSRGKRTHPYDLDIELQTQSLGAPFWDTFELPTLFLATSLEYASRCHFFVLVKEGRDVHSSMDANIAQALIKLAPLSDKRRSWSFKLELIAANQSVGILSGRVSVWDS